MTYTTDRRDFLARAALGGLGLTAAGCAPALEAGTRSPLSPLIDDLEQRTFAFFWETVNRRNGLVPDRWPDPPFASIAAVGFALTVYPLAVERGWITRTDARDLTLTTLRFFAAAPQGTASSGISGHRGFFYHFLDMDRGHRFRDTELSSVDSSLLFLGMIFAGLWFDGADPVEREIRTLADRIVARADWPWFQNGTPDISMGWFPDKGFIARSWDGYNEGMMVYLLALGTPGRTIADDGWAAWTAPYPKAWRGTGDTRRLAFAPLFGHQYSHMWIDFRGIRDSPMREAGLDYFENSRRAVYANRAYCAANPMRWEGYSRDIWGLTACDGPGGFTRQVAGVERRFHGYAARGPIGEPDGLDDGTIAPTAALASIPFAPEICLRAAAALHERHGTRIYGRYGFLDSFNPSFRDTAAPLKRGRVDPVHGWVATDYLGIDQGPILGMLANHRSDAVWRVMRRSPIIRRGLIRAGFTGGWLDA
jgi:hypothetical protein